MRKMKQEAYEGPAVYPLITEPNQAFTPRQILEQFARNELTAKVFEPSDNINSDNYSDDQMVDNSIEFEDEFEAIEFMKSTKVVKDESKKDESVQDVDEGNKQPQEPDQE